MSVLGIVLARPAKIASRAAGITGGQSRLGRCTYGSLENTVGSRFYARWATEVMVECESEMMPVALIKILTKRCNNFDAARDMCRP